MSRIGNVFLHDEMVGKLSELVDGQYLFEYTDEFMKSGKQEGVSLALPPSQQKYLFEDKFPSFFDGLIPEGWLLGHALTNWKLQRKDPMGLLLNLCHDTIGATSIVEQGQTPIKKRPYSFKKKQKSDQTIQYKTNRCLISYRQLKEIEGNLYSPKEAKKMYGDKLFQKSLSIGLNDLEQMAKEQINTRLSLTGMQKKISLEMRDIQSSKKLTIIDFNENFILKPPSVEYPNMPEIEHLCMKMARIAGFDVPDCALIPLKTGELSFIVKRFDRKKGRKLYQEDFCQLLDKSRDDKYNASIEKCSKVIQKYCHEVVPNMALFFDLSFYNYLIGNADMHLKNFSLVKNKKTQNYQLSPCYDLLSTKILIPDDHEQIALSINGKKNKLLKNDWDALAVNMGLGKIYLENTLSKYQKYIPKMIELIKISFLTEKNKKKLSDLMNKNYSTVLKGP